METTLKAELRDVTGKGAAHKIRATGRVPAVLYGHGVTAANITVDARDLLHLFHSAGGTNTLVDLELNGDVHLTIPREIQRDYIHGKFLHVDFFAVRRDERITLFVPVQEVGDSVGVRAGGVVEHHLREIEIECLPTDVPEHLEADISAMEIGDMLHVRDIPAPSGVTILSPEDTPVISVITPAALRVELELELPGEEAPAAAAEEEAPEEGEEGAPAEGEAPAEGAPAEEGGES